MLFTGRNHKRTYIGWVNKHGDILIGGLDHDTQKPLQEVLIKGAIHKLQRASWAFLDILDIFWLFENIIFVNTQLLIVETKSKCYKNINVVGEVGEVGEVGMG